MSWLSEFSSCVRERRNITIGFLSALPFVVAVALCLFGQLGPTVLYQDDFNLPSWYGVGRLPLRVWETMQTPGRTVRYDGYWDRFWGGLKGEDGDMLVAVGPRAVAGARCRAPGLKYGGKMRGWFALSHVKVLTYAAICSACIWTAMILGLSFARFRRSLPEGYCARCGYNLTGLPQGHRCPECGVVSFRQHVPSQRKPSEP